RASDLARHQELASGAKGTRTPDPVLAKHVLFQLSYSPGYGAPRVPGARPGTRSPAAAPVAPAPRAAPSARPPPVTSSAGAPAPALPPASAVPAQDAPAAGTAVSAPARSAGNSVIRGMKWGAPASRSRSGVA